MTNPQMQFGTKKTIQDLDDQGSTKTTIATYKEGRVVGNVREVYEERHKVHNKLEQAAVYHRYEKEADNDPSRKDLKYWEEGRGNKSKDHWYFVTSYTRIHS